MTCATHPDQVRRHMGLTGQVATVDELLTGRENIRMIGGLYGIRRKDLEKLGDQLLQQFSLADAADRVVKSYSGGMRRRLDLAVSLLASPPVLFLDEPTTGLDPRSRSELWEVLRGLVAQGTTLLLTTQYLEEADQLADNIVVIDRGPHHRAGFAAGTQAAGGSARAWWSPSPTPQTWPRPGSCSPGPGPRYTSTPAARQLTASAEGLDDMTRVAGWLRTAASRSTTSACPGPASTMCSCRSPVTAPKTTEEVARMTVAAQKPPSTLATGRSIRPRISRSSPGSWSSAT